MLTDLTESSSPSIRPSRPSAIARPRWSAAATISQPSHHDAKFTKPCGNLAANGSWQGGIQNRRKDGSRYPEWLTISNPTSRGNPPATSVFTDNRAHQGIGSRNGTAHHDALTGLPNRLLPFRGSVWVAHGESVAAAAAPSHHRPRPSGHVNESGHPVGTRFSRKSPAA